MKPFLYRCVAAYSSGMSAVARLFAVLAALVLVAMVVQILIEIAMRAFYGTSSGVLDEFVGYGVAASSFCGLAYALEREALIRVTLLGRVADRHPAVARLLEGFAILVTLAAFALVIRYFLLSVERHWERGTVSETIAEVPMWIPEGAMLIGMAVFWLALLGRLLRLLVGEAPRFGSASSSLSAEG